MSWNTCGSRVPGQRRRVDGKFLDAGERSLVLLQPDPVCSALPPERALQRQVLFAVRTGWSSTGFVLVFHISHLQPCLEGSADSASDAHSTVENSHRPAAARLAEGEASNAILITRGTLSLLRTGAGRWARKQSGDSVTHVQDRCQDRTSEDVPDKSRYRFQETKSDSEFM